MRMNCKLKSKFKWTRIFAFLMGIMIVLIEIGRSYDFICYATENQNTQNQESTNSENSDTSQTDTTQTQASEVVKAKELDLGDCQSEMTVGAKQLLVVTVLPTNTTDQTLTYTSSNEDIATINGLGRITAVAIGTTKITVKCGKVKESFDLTVKEAQSTEAETIAVTGIEFNDFEEDLEVDKTVTLTATVIPAKATDSTITYTSSNPAVATVNATGEVKGISQGTVTITAKAGDVEENATINVKVSAIEIEINSTYLVLSPQEEFKLSAKAIPSESSQSITYKSKDESIARVSSDGTVTAKAKGNTTILVSNGDISNAVTVIVNESGTESQQEETQETLNQGESTKKEEYTESEQELVDLIDKNEGDIKVNVSDYSMITKKVLKRLYEKKAVLVISGTDYTLQLNGEDIRNYENELNTKIEFVSELNGKSFVLNENNNMPGNITLTLNNASEKFIYLYNDAKDKYEILGNQKDNVFQLDDSGKYLILDNKLTSATVKIAIVVGAAIVILGIFAVYVFLRRRYWFW